MMKEGDMELISEIAKFEASVDMEKEYRIGWSWRHVRIWPATLSRLFKDGYLDNVFRSNSFTGYKLSEKAKALFLANQQAASAEPQSAPPVELGDDLFSDIIGHEEVKELLTATLLAEKPVHVLLTGPPALAKTLFPYTTLFRSESFSIRLLAAITLSGLWISSALPLLALTSLPPSIIVSKAAISTAFILSISSISNILGSLSATRSQSPALEVAEPTSQIACSPKVCSISQRNRVLAKAGGPVNMTCTGFSASSVAMSSSLTS